AEKGARRQDYRPDQRLELWRGDNPEPQAQAVRRRPRTPRPDLSHRPLGRGTRAVQDRDRSYGWRGHLPPPAARPPKRGAAADCRILARHRKVAGGGETVTKGSRRRRAQLRTPQPQRRSTL